MVGFTVQEDESDDGEVEEKERFLQTLLYILSVVALYAGIPYLYSGPISLNLFMISWWIASYSFYAN